MELLNSLNEEKRVDAEAREVVADSECVLRMRESQPSVAEVLTTSGRLIFQGSDKGLWKRSQIEDGGKTLLTSTSERRL